MIKGRTIRLRLLDEDATGIIEASKPNWNGKIYKIPKKRLSDNIDIEDLKSCGIYFLLGQGDEDDNSEYSIGDNIAYVGKANKRANGKGVLSRVLEHQRNGEKTFFDECLILTINDGYFGDTEIAYLENKFYNLIKKADRYILDNNNEPSSGMVTEEIESEMLEPIDCTKQIVGAMGYKLFKKVRENLSDEKLETTFYLKNKQPEPGSEYNAEMIRTNEGYLVIKGSKIRLIENDYISRLVMEARKQVELKGDIIQEDVIFNKSSAAAQFVTGTSVNGRISWKTDDDMTLDEVERMLAKKAEEQNNEQK